VTGCFTYSCILYKHSTCRNSCPVSLRPRPSQFLGEVHSLRLVGVGVGVGVGAGAQENPSPPLLLNANTSRPTASYLSIPFGLTFRTIIEPLISPVQRSSTWFVVSLYLRFHIQVSRNSSTKLADPGPTNLGRQELINSFTLNNQVLGIMASPSAHAQIAKILEMAKETHWLENKHLPSDEIQRQWAVKSAPLATVLGIGAPTCPIDLESAAESAAPLQNAQTISPPPVSIVSSRRRDTVCFYSIIGYTKLTLD